MTKALKNVSLFKEQNSIIDLISSNVTPSDEHACQSHKFVFSRPNGSFLRIDATDLFGRDSSKIVVIILLSPL